MDRWLNKEQSHCQKVGDEDGGKLLGRWQFDQTGSKLAVLMLCHFKGKRKKKNLW